MMNFPIKLNNPLNILSKNIQKKNSYTALEIAYTFIDQLHVRSLDDHNFSPTNMKIQKLLYYAQSQHMKNNKGTPLFQDDFEAWSSGPVIRNVYKEFSHYFSNPIDRPKNEKLPHLNNAATQTINSIINKIGFFDTWRLSQLTHKEYGAWHQVKTKEKIKDLTPSNPIISKDSIMKEVLDIE